MLTTTHPTGLDRDTRRRLGSYYTPAPLVSHLVAAILSPLLDGLRRRAAKMRGHLDEIGLPRLLDPAMGDGVFLSAAADLIARALSSAASVPVEEGRRLVVARCLTGVDIDPAAVALARESLEARRGSSALIQDDFLAAVAPVAGPFDAVIGNPPWGGWNRTLGREAKLDLRGRFATARGLIDPFSLFLERSTSLLLPGGRLGMVLPDYFLLKNYPAARRHVLDNYRIEELTHWGRAFRGVNLDVCTIVATRTTSPARGEVIKCFPEGPSGRLVRAPRSRFAGAPGFTFNLSLDARQAALLGRLTKSCVALGDLLETHEGIHSGNIRPKLFLPPRTAGPLGSRRSRVRPLVLGRREIRPFLLRPEGWRVVYDRDLIDRDAGEYANLGDERWFLGPKLLVRRTGDVVIAALDREGLCASNNLFVALTRPGCTLPLEYLEGFLNSSLATWSFRAIQPRAGRLFAELKLVHLARLPVPVPRGRQSGRAIDHVVGLVRGLRRRARAVTSAGAGRRGGAPAPGAFPLLDAAFARLAGLSPADEKMILRKTFSPPGASPL